MKKKNIDNTDFLLGELFCGPGGIAWGAKKASVKLNRDKYQIVHAWATDYDKDTCDTYAKISQIYKRLNPDKPAYTVTGGSGTHMYH